MARMAVRCGAVRFSPHVCAAAPCPPPPASVLRRGSGEARPGHVWGTRTSRARGGPCRSHPHQPLPRPLGPPHTLPDRLTRTSPRERGTTWRGRGCATAQAAALEGAAEPPRSGCRSGGAERGVSRARPAPPTARYTCAPAWPPRRRRRPPPPPRAGAARVPRRRHGTRCLPKLTAPWRAQRAAWRCTRTPSPARPAGPGMRRRHATRTAALRCRRRADAPEENPTRTCDSDSRAPAALPTAPPLRARGLESDFAETENLEVGSSVRQGAGRVCGTGSAARH